MAKSTALNMSNTFGVMGVLTLNVHSRNQYLTTVFLNDKLWDTVISNNVDDAVYTHAKFCDMCKLFSPLAAKLGTTDENEKRELVNELVVIASANAAMRHGLN